MGKLKKPPAFDAADIPLMGELFKMNKSSEEKTSVNFISLFFFPLIARPS